MLTLANLILGCVAAAFGLGVAVLSGVFWSPGDHWPFAVPTTTSTTITTFYSVGVASKAVVTGCAAVGSLSSEFMRDESRGVRVTYSVSGADNKIETIERARAVLPKYASIVSAASALNATLEQNAGTQRWRPVTTALNKLAANCRLLGEPTVASVPFSP
jgi:hypothetical protein